MMDVCTVEEPMLTLVGEKHRAACHLLKEGGS
jgi:hypothetical protein